MSSWIIQFCPEFTAEYEHYSEAFQDSLAAALIRLAHGGPTLSRPLVDTLKNSKHKNLKELRFKANDGVWRVAFAFDPLRRAIILVAGDKAGQSQSKFYDTLIDIADARFDRHLATLKEGDLS